MKNNIKHHGKGTLESANHQRATPREEGLVTWQLLNAKTTGGIKAKKAQRCVWGKKKMVK